MLGQIYYTFSIIVYKMLMNGRPISNPYFNLCSYIGEGHYKKGNAIKIISYKLLGHNSLQTQLV